jgi:cytochrome c oxidase subunit 4
MAHTHGTDGHAAAPQGAHGDAQHHEHSSHHVGHVVPLKVLAATFGALIFLTIVTVGVSYVELGPFNLFVALFVALCKASVVMLYFMHMRWDRPFNSMVLISSFAFVVLFIGIALVDTEAYHGDLIPGYSPGMTRTP